MTCPACQKLKIACLVNKVRRGELVKQRKEGKKVKTTKKEKGKSVTESGGGRAIDAVVELLTELVTETRRHHERMESLMSQMVEDSIYAPPSSVAEPRIEMEPMTEAEEALVRQMSAELKEEKDRPLEWAASRPQPSLGGEDMRQVWKWFFRKGQDSATAVFAEQYQGLTARLRLLEGDGSESGEESGPSGPSIEPGTGTTSEKRSEEGERGAEETEETEETEEQEDNEGGDADVDAEVEEVNGDPEVQEVGQGVEDMVVG